MHPAHPSVGEISTRRLLLRLATAMLAGGTPAYEVEEEMTRLGRVLGYPSVQCAATPTGVELSLASGQAAAYERITGSLRLDQLTHANDIRRDLMAGRIGIGQGLAALAELPDVPPRFPWWARLLGTVAVSSGICLIVQPGIANVAFCAVLGLVVGMLMLLPRRFPTLAVLLPTAAAFVVATAAFLAAHHGLLAGPLRTLICPLAVLLPGATLATALAELAAASMIAGSSRLVYGVIQLTLFALGIVLAAGLVGVDWGALNTARATGPLGLVAAPLGLVVIAVGMTLTESMPPRLMPWAFGLLCLTYATQAAGQVMAGAAAGAFAGAVVASFGAAVIVLVSPRVPRMVIFLPSFWLLVPGTLGLLSLTQIGSGSSTATAVLVPIVGLTMSLALGVLVGSAAARPLPRIARAVNWKRRREQARARSIAGEATSDAS